MHWAVKNRYFFGCDASTKAAPCPGSKGWQSIDVPANLRVPPPPPPPTNSAADQLGDDASEKGKRARVDEMPKESVQQVDGDDGASEKQAWIDHNLFLFLFLALGGRAGGAKPPSSRFFLARKRSSSPPSQHACQFPRHAPRDRGRHAPVLPRAARAWLKPQMMTNHRSRSSDAPRGPRPLTGAPGVGPPVRRAVVNGAGVGEGGEYGAVTASPTPANDAAGRPPAGGEGEGAVAPGQPPNTPDKRVDTAANITQRTPIPRRCCDVRRTKGGAPWQDARKIRTHYLVGRKRI